MTSFVNLFMPDLFFLRIISI